MRRCHPRSKPGTRAPTSLRCQSEREQLLLSAEFPCVGMTRISRSAVAAFTARIEEDEIVNGGRSLKMPRRGIVQSGVALGLSAAGIGSLSSRAAAAQDQPI